MLLTRVRAPLVTASNSIPEAVMQPLESARHLRADHAFRRLSDGNLHQRKESRSHYISLRPAVSTLAAGSARLSGSMSDAIMLVHPSDATPLA